jgi:hypothetical protein
MRRSASLSGLDPSAQASMSEEVAEREAALAKQLAAAEARAQSATVERDAIKVRVCGLGGVWALGRVVDASRARVTHQLPTPLPTRPAVPINHHHTATGARAAAGE